MAYPRANAQNYMNPARDTANKHTRAVGGRSVFVGV